MLLGSITARPTNLLVMLPFGFVGNEALVISTSVAAPVDSSHDPAQSGLTRPDLDSVGTLIPKPRQMVVMRFGLAAYQDLRAEKFAGVAIKPLRTASFAVAPEMFTKALAAN